MTEQADLDALAKAGADAGGGGAEIAAGGGGDGTRQPTDRAELVKWLNLLGSFGSAPGHALSLQ